MLAVNRGVQETREHYCLCYLTESQDLYAEVFTNFHQKRSY